MRILPLNKLNPLIMDCVFLSGRSSTSMPLSFKLLISVSATTSSPINKEKKNRKKRKESKVE